MLPVDADGTQVEDAGCTHHHVQRHKYIAVQTAKEPRATDHLQMKQFYMHSQTLSNIFDWILNRQILYLSTSLQSSKMSTVLYIWTALISHNPRCIRGNAQANIQTLLIFHSPLWNAVVMDGWVVSNKALVEMLQLCITDSAFTNYCIILFSIANSAISVTCSNELRDLELTALLLWSITEASCLLQVYTIALLNF